ncbi:hypothetical protein [Peredibacter starrii]|uniref:Lipoprotein n=1 Tax=Peredibacter starrii TaxID=28202 RepID=A0AAX4HNQ2_9BACT|nr:hypothetical protein [Peredibacter starrii]WPU64802.1 hypothetical protein SOO65_19085 [Peredibacter starrii]
MKYFFLFTLLLVIGCQDAKKTGPVPEKVAQSEDELLKGDFALIPAIKGLMIEGGGMQKEGDLIMTEDLVIKESKTKKALDEFPMLDWGLVGFKVDGQVLRVQPVKDVMEIEYFADENEKIKRTVKCEFKSQNQNETYEDLMKNARSAKPDWEDVFEGLANLAKEGHKSSYNFFMEPSAEDKKLYQAGSAVASVDEIFRILSYMKKNGCKW